MGIPVPSGGPPPPPPLPPAAPPPTIASASTQAAGAAARAKNAAQAGKGFSGTELTSGQGVAPAPGAKAKLLGDTE